MKSIICGDVKDRLRQSNYLWMIIFLIFAVCLVDLPNASYYTLLVSPNYFAQMNNVTWIIMSVMTVFGFLMPPIEWVFIKNAEEIDRSNRIYTWMFSTSLNKQSYVVGKFISNVIILLSLWLTIVFVTAIIGIIKFPDELSLLISRLPNFLIFLPGIIAIAACALLFENFKSLRGTFGTVIGIVGYFVIYATTTFKSTLWNFLNFSDSSIIINLIHNDAQKNNVVNANISVLGTSTHANLEKHNLVFSPIALTTQDTIMFLLQLLLAVVVLGIVYYTLHDFTIYNSQPIIKGHEEVYNSSIKVNKAKKYSSYKKKSSILGMILGELKREWYGTSTIRKAILIIIWVIAWSVPAKSTMEVLAFLFLLGLKYYDHLGTTIINTGIFNFIGSINKARNNQFFAETIAALLITIVILMPAIIKNQMFGIYLSFAVATVLLCEMFGRLTRSVRPIQLISVCYWFVYLNGGNLLSNSLYYIVIAIVSLVILFLNEATFLKDNRKI
ncbi:hypothetical protein [Limosilactobacillus reuteri]|uniref:hypothetical protein n=1 Tax=Limosilactobacillus reuteri TaxID=1598 RepID=UPI00129B8E7F|nr:hypothetical protein [Limosilactobacillus reuteri]MRG62941.1 hypothetical protein [Limosilactobacillus reuteri]MRH31719.1 hypothetical protein [Limosilactobacillus reuteri]